MADDDNVQVTLYKLDEPVKNEIFKALNFYSKFDTTRNLILLERANTCLMNEYDTITTDATTSEPIVSNVADNLYKTNVNNTVNAFGGFLQALQSRYPNDKVLALTINNYQKMVLDSLT